jgi:murein DD-endopeptidase MepM/ murein hydrolase activator NlpD
MSSGVGMFNEQANRPLSKPISSSEVEGASEAQNQSVLNVHEGHWRESQISPKPHEDSSIEATNKFAEGIELRNKSNIIPVALLAFAFLVSVREYCSFKYLKDSFSSYSCQNQSDEVENGEQEEEDFLDEELDALSQQSNASKNAQTSTHKIVCDIDKSAVESGKKYEKKTVVEVNSGDTLSLILDGFNIKAKDIDTISRKLSKVHDLKSLQIGQSIVIEFTEDKEPTIKRLELNDKIGNKIIILKKNDSYALSREKKQLKTFLKGTCATINTNFVDSAFGEGIPKPVILEAVKTANSVINVNKLRRGDYFEILYEEDRDADSGKLIGHRSLKYVSVKVKGKVYRLYSWKKNGYYNEKGESTKTSFLAIPLKDKRPRITSKFGWRRHPILGILRPHNGVDFAAQYGSEVCAAANGTVVWAGRNGNYGLYLKIRHVNGFETTYAHLSSIFVHSGAIVRQGEVIGRVGRSGLANGAHLHHEVIHLRSFVDPQKHYSLAAERLSGKDLLKFNQMKSECARKVNELKAHQQTA